MDFNLLPGIILVSVTCGLLCGGLLTLLCRGTLAVSFTLKERFSVLLICCLATAIFFGFYAVVSGVAYYLYYVIAFFGVVTPMSVVFLPNWFGVYSKKEEIN